MYFSAVPVLVILLLMVSPIFWVVRWMLADISEHASGKYTGRHRVA